MASPTQLIRHIESFVDSAGSPSQQAASIEALVALLKTNSITIEQLVREMQMYLTTTDDVLRARGILLLGEVLGCLESKPLDSTSVHSLIGFFADRLADWRALRGALVGCLALLRRKSDVGMVTVGDAKAVIESLLQNLQLQSLGLNDRKLSFEILECLLVRHPEAAATMGDHLVYGICEAIDEEKDPQCLMLVFHIVEVLARLFPDPAGPMASFAKDMFEILGRYFPVHYTHPKNEDVSVSRDDLSRALMLAFSSSSFFEPFAIPLLLEKLSSSLPSAKIDSLRYLTSCTLKYGHERLRNHNDAIWRALKTTIYSLFLEPTLLSELNLFEGVDIQENDIGKEALNLLQTIVSDPEDDFLSLVLSDDDITSVMNTISSFRSYHNISLENKQKLLAVSCIISALVKASKTFCNKVFETLFPRVVETLEVPLDGSVASAVPKDSDTRVKRLNFGALYMCVQILGSCRNLSVSSRETSLSGHFVGEPWCHVLGSFSETLMKTFTCGLVVHRTEQDWVEVVPLSVKGIQILATFPGDFCIISKAKFMELLSTLVSIVRKDFKVTSLWNLALKALVQIGVFIDQYREPGKLQCFADIVVEGVTSLMEIDDATMPYPLILDVICDISTTGPTFLLTIIQAMERTVLSKFSKVHVDENLDMAGCLVQLMGCYCCKVLPRLLQNRNPEDNLSHFPIGLLDLIENLQTSSAVLTQNDLLNQTMTTLKLTVAACSEKDQRVIVQKAFTVISSSATLSSMESPSVIVPDLLERLQLTQELGNLTCKDEWLLSSFSSVIIAMRPETPMPSVRMTVWIFLNALLRGHVSSAQALASMLNKKHSSMEAEDSKCFSAEDALELILKVISGKLYENVADENCLSGGEDKLSLDPLGISSLQIHSMTGLAWIGKGLLMRGHQKVKDIMMIFLRLLLSSSGLGDLLLQQKGCLEEDKTDYLVLMRAAADAFHILISDSEDCLNKKFHAISGPLYKQRLFSTLIPVLLSSIVKTHSSFTRSLLFRAFGHIVSGAPLVAIASESKKIVPVLLEALLALSEDASNKDMIYNLLLVLSSLLMDKNGKETIIDNASAVVSCLTQLVSYPHKMLVRETALQCLVAMSTLPYTRIYPMRPQVLRAVSKVLNDPKRAVRQEAVRCHHAWGSIA